MFNKFLYHLADVFAASCLLVLLNKVFILLNLGIVYLYLVLHDDPEGTHHGLLADRLIFPRLRALDFFNLTVQDFGQVFIPLKLFVDEGR